MTRLQFGGVLPTWLVLLLVVVGSILIWLWYFRETRYCRLPYSYLLPTLRALAFALIVLMLAGPSLIREWISGELSRIVFLVDTSTSMELTDAVDLGEGAEETSAQGLSTKPKDSEPTHLGTRLERIEHWLSDGKGTDEPASKESHQGWLAAQRRMFHMQVLAFSADVRGDVLSRVWDSASHSLESDIALELPATGNRTSIGDAISELLQGWVREPKSEALIESQNRQNLAAVVLLTDGQSNAGESPLAVVEQMAGSKVPIFSIAYGRDQEPDDLGILTVDHTRNLFRADSFQGKVVIKQQVPEGTAFQLKILHEDRTAWTQSLISDGQPSRTVEFRVPGEKFFPAEAGDSRQKAIPIELEFQVEYRGFDASPSNNRLPSSLWGVVRKNRVMVVDRRGRWETRYIKNAFQRDSTWELETVLGPEEFKAKTFPKSREELAGLDLLVVTIDSVGGLSDTQWKWLQDFVADVGGGIIWIDSGREPPPETITKSQVQWFPVLMTADAGATAVTSLELKDAALEQRAFAFEQDSAANRRLWSVLPPPRVARRVELSPGAELLVSGLAESKREWPMIASRRYGQGRIVYLANDETWRWRYNVADLYHQRFWNQLAQWAMQTPFAVENDFVALDAGYRTYSIGQDVPLRARVRDANQTPLQGGLVRAILSRDDGSVEEVALSEDSNAPGTYSVNVRSLLPGKYEVKLGVAGIPDEALNLRTEFMVQPPNDREMEALAANRSLLRQIATTTGGESFAESDREHLVDSLRKYQKGRINQSQTLLWQSYPWFAATIALLSLEWFLRKRAGLV
ncbi:MAG: vWA domain-containing protein [Planctomycetota bacterium]